MLDHSIAAMRTKIVGLPPFWTAFAFTCLVGLPQAFLALPIAAAPFGSIGGIVIVGAFGLLHVLTVAAVAAATARRSDPSVPPMLLAGRVRAALGAPAEWLVSAAQAITFFLALIASALGLSLTLDAETGVPSALWLGVLAAAAMTLVSRAALGLGVLVSLGLLNVVVILLVAIAIGFDGRTKHFDGPGGGLAGPSAEDWARILGVTLISYFGHALVGQAARLSVARDPGGNALVRGSVAGMATLSILLCGWVAIVDADLWPGDLTGQRGTVLVAIEEVHGGWVTALGTMLVVTLPGLTTLRCVSVLAGVTKERVPRLSRADSAEESIVRWRRWMATHALALVAFALVGVMLFTGSGSFTSVLEAAGVLGVATFAGVIPPLLLLATRSADGAHGASWMRILGRPIVAYAISGFFFGIMLLHVTVLWSNPEERIAGVGVCAAVALVCGGAMRRMRVRSPHTSPRLSTGLAAVDSRPD